LRVPLQHLGLNVGPGVGYAIMQWPEDAFKSAGESVDLTCYQNMDMRAYMFWYQQLSRSSLKLIVSTAPWLQNSYEEGYSEAKFDVSRENKLSVMTIKNVTSKDAATYFCLCFLTAPVIFGVGTVIKVIPPAVAIFSPSKQEIQQKNKATLVCLASGFYPDNLNLVWKVNGVKRTEGVGTDETSTSNGSTYALTSRLRISAQDLHLFLCGVVTQRLNIPNQNIVSYHKASLCLF
uniref:Ig-like domain-containing protein n=1 Tax=Coturnix japonica TaxID=93934 RepID=A0A8C2YEV5_COTJA